MTPPRAVGTSAGRPGRLGVAMSPAATHPAEVPAGGDRDVREVTAIMNLALRIGELLLSSGAGASDVSAAMRNVAWACGLRRYTADVMFTELTMSEQPSSDEPALIQIRHVRSQPAYAKRCPSANSRSMQTSSYR